MFIVGRYVYMTKSGITNLIVTTTDKHFLFVPESCTHAIKLNLHDMRNGCGLKWNPICSRGGQQNSTIASY